MKNIIFLIFFLFQMNLLLTAQDNVTAMEHWRNIPSYYGPSSLINDNGNLWVSTSYGMYEYNIIEGTYKHHSKVTGMNDATIEKIAMDASTGIVIVAYDNANLDIYRGGEFHNVPDIKIANVIGSKQIYDIVAHDGKAYLSTHLGLIIVDLWKYQISSTIPFYEGAVKGINYQSIIVGDEIYTATSVGLFKSKLDNVQIQNYATWDALNPNAFDGLAYNSGHFFAMKNSANNDSVFYFKNDFSTKFLMKDNNLQFIKGENGGYVWIAKNYDAGIGYVKLIDKDNNEIQTAPAFQPRGVTMIGSEIYVIDDDKTSRHGGLKRKLSATDYENLSPRGPESNFSSDIWVQNNQFWIAHGGVNALYGPTGNTSFVSSYLNNEWKSYRDGFLAIGGLQDAYVLLRDKVSKNMLVGHSVSGLSEITPDGNVINQKSPNLEPVNGDPSSFKVMGLAQDADGNVWMGNYWSDYELKVRTKNGTWYKYHAPANTNRMAGKMVVDNYGTKWYLAPNGGGVVGYNEKETFENTSDDLSRVLKVGKGSGNLPSNMTRSIAVDRDGYVWIGTSNGIAIIERPQQALEGTAEAEIKIVQFEGFNFASPLFEGNDVTSIAVDGANRKWIGTASSGVFLISENLNKQIYRFTTDNSPLPSDVIQNISIDHITGNVYFSTSKGIAMFRSTATAPQESSFAETLHIFPNPVPQNFGGLITISGLMENSDVRITDAIGQLVNMGRSNGGTYVWNGKDYSGRGVQSGVYIIFAMDKTGKESQLGKIIINEQ